MSSKNIFEVLQNIAENTESSEKFLNILKENGFTGTLEEAENQINQQTQVVLNNLTTEDLQNIAGGKSLMNDKLKKAIAVGGASLMAAGTVMPSGSARDMNKVKKTVTGHANKVVDYVKNNPVHTTITSILGVAAATLLFKSILGDQPVLYDLSKKDLSEERVVCELINQCVLKICKITVREEGGKQFLKIKLGGDLLKNELWNEGNTLEYTVDGFLLKLAVLMDGGRGTYVNKDQTLTSVGAKVLNESKNLILSAVSYAAIADETKDKESLMETDDEKKSSSVSSQSSSSSSDSSRSISSSSEEERDKKKKEEMKEVVVKEDIEKKEDENDNKLTMLDKAKTELVTYAEGKLNEVNGPEVDGQNNEARLKFVNDLKAKNGEKFNEDIAEFENFKVLKQEKILSEEIIGNIREIITTELEEVAKLTEKPDNTNAYKEKVKEDIDKVFENIRQSLEKQEQQSVVKNDNDVPVENKSNKPVQIILRTRRKFREGDKVNSEQKTDDVNENNDNEIQFDVIVDDDAIS